MNPAVKLTAGALLVVAAVGYLAWMGAAASWQYYLSVDEAFADAAHLEGKRLRVSGHVTGGTLSIGDDRRQATFDLAGEQHTLQVTCGCLLPDNLAEGIDVVVEGRFEAGVIHGDKVITRCASKYQPADPTPVGDEAPAAPVT
jgi:cytochrome c-type biogenesis protein CcmE